MKALRSTAALLLTLLLALPGVAPADTSSVSADELDAALDTAAADQAAARHTVRALLARDDVREIAGRAGLDLSGADRAVDALDGDELIQLASSAASAQADLAGGQTITISVVTALLIIIIVILLAG